MKTNLVPIKVILKRRANGEADWPNFNVIDSAKRDGKPWSKFIDSGGIGWLYDKIDNLGTGAPNGTACTLIPEDFANAAVAEFPTLVSIISEVDFETFYEERAVVRMPTEFLDTDVLQGIVARKQLEDLGEAPAPSQEIVDARAKCLDPSEQNYRGIRKNLKKKWADAKVDMNVEVHSTYAK